jgi:signal transduction histidine kinase
VFSLSGKQRVELDQEMLEALQLIAEQVAIATANAQLYAETRALAVDLEKRVEERTRQLQEAQERMMRTEKLAVAGHLAAAMAHEINNPLQSMRLYLGLIADQLENGPPNREYLDVVQEQIDRIAGIVSQLLGQLYQPTEESYTLVDLNTLITDLMILFDRQLRDTNIHLQLDLTEDLPPIIGAPNGLRQVCMNVLVNAIEAMPNGGTLRIASQVQGSTARVTFTDSGVGIPPSVLRRVFDPFYTTKPKGTGLGLAVSYRIMQEHGGDLLITSQPGVSTTASLILPFERASTRQEANPAATVVHSPPV